MLALTKQERIVLISVLGILWCGSIIQAFAKSDQRLYRAVHMMEGDAFYPKVDINIAGERELERLPYIGPALARRIIQYRQENGGFKNVNEVKLVDGFRKSAWPDISKYLKASPPP